MSMVRILTGSQSIRVHLTNVTAQGAVQLAKSLLPALETCPGYKIETLYLPATGELASYEPSSSATQVYRERRYLGNSISRLIECTVGARRFDGASPLLVLGDLPLATRSTQTVFLQNALLTDPRADLSVADLRHRIGRWILQRNKLRVSNFIVQSAGMRDAFLENFPEFGDRIHVIAQPVPHWLAAHRGARIGRTGSVPDAPLKLLYASAGYPHKNHALLRGLNEDGAAEWGVEELKLTIPPNANPAPAVSWISCVGRLDVTRMIDAYMRTDALVFLSLTESFGFPLVEAMWIGLPVVCPDLAYARELCGEPAIYFDPRDLRSLQSAVYELRQRLARGWWPDWSDRLAKLPNEWTDVARRILHIVNT